MNSKEDSLLTISIVTYKHTFEQLKPVWNSVLTIKNRKKVFIIDNSPQDDLRNDVHDDDVEYFFNNGNIGFGSAHNIAIKKAIQLGSKYHLVLNPDIYFKGNIMFIMINYLEKNLNVGLMMPQILYPNGQIQYLPKLLPSPFQLIKRKLKFFEKWNNWYEMRNVSPDLIYEAPIISGCFSLFRTEVFQTVGFYDERYFMYFEDFDISRRTHKYFKTVYFPAVSVYHEYERGAQKNFRLFKIFINSAIKYFNKWGWIFDSERENINKEIFRKIE